MKRLMPVLLTIGIALATAACGVGKGNENTPQPAPSVSITPMSIAQQAVAKAPDAIDRTFGIKYRHVHAFLTDDRSGGGSYEWVVTVNESRVTFDMDLWLAYDLGIWDEQSKNGEVTQIGGLEMIIHVDGSAADPTILAKYKSSNATYFVMLRVSGWPSGTRDALIKAGTAIATCLNQA